MNGQSSEMLTKQFEMLINQQFNRKGLQKIEINIIFKDKSTFRLIDEYPSADNLQTSLQKDILTSEKLLKSPRQQVFISYSHQDREYFDSLKKHLKPVMRENLIVVWDDTMIKAGTEWRNEIKKALTSAKVAVLLVSPNFLASDFIAEVEFPDILEASKKDGLCIIWIAVSHSMYKKTAIEKYQCANNPEKPLVSLGISDQDKEFVNIIETIISTIKT